MKIETLTEWNTILNGCECCQVPEHVAPIQQWKYWNAEVDLYSWNGYNEKPEDPGYQTMVRHWSNGGTDTSGFVNGVAAWLAGVLLTTPHSHTFTATGDCTGTETYTFSNPISFASAQSTGHSALDANAFSVDASSVWEDSAPIGSWTDYVGEEVAYSGGVMVASAIYAKGRWKVPSTFTGSWLKVTWDVYDFPTVGAPSVVSVDNVWNWSGPGDPDAPDGATWLSSEFDIVPPAIAGQRRVVNIRYESWSSAQVGSKPSIMGEGYAP